jgi:hypothetical protein
MLLHVTPAGQHLGQGQRAPVMAVWHSRGVPQRLPQAYPVHMSPSVECWYVGVESVLFLSRARLELLAAGGGVDSDICVCSHQ